MLRVHRYITSVVLLNLAWALLTSIAAAADLVQASGVTGGMVVHVNCGDGELTAELRADEKYVVQGLAIDAIDKARAHIESLGLYGAASVRRLEGDRLPYASDLINLVVVSKGSTQPSLDELIRVLAPRGVLLSQTKTKGARPSGVEGWWKTVKPVPDEIDEWTHYLHGPGNNAVADDKRVGPPERIQWKAGPMWCRSHEFASSICAMVSANGRLFSVVDEGVIGQPRGVPTFWTLVARDAFNGVLLWKRPLFGINPHALVAVGDRVFVTMTKGGALSALDAATGDLLYTSAESGAVGDVALFDGKLVFATQIKTDKGKASPHVAAANPADGKLIWKTPARKVTNNALVVGNDRVCYHDGVDLVGLDLTTGKEEWRRPVKGGSYVVIYEDTVFVTGGSTLAYSLATGEPFWKGLSGTGKRPPGLFGAGGLMWGAWEGNKGGRSFVWEPQKQTRLGYDPHTGETLKEVSVDALVTAGHHIRCYPPKATSRYLLLNKRGIEFFDLEGDNHMRANWTRGACRFGVLPANGLVYTPPSQCFCYPGAKLDGFHALASTRDDEVVLIKKKDRLERGPAYGKTPKPTAKRAEALAKEWATYRGNAKRSGSTQAELPVKLKRLWETSICDTGFVPSAEAVDETEGLRAYPNGGITPPVAADGRLYTAERDAHVVRCLDARNGKPLWSYTADGRVDSSPTIHNGLVLFGSVDGRAYCLRASDGALVWRFMAAPEDRQITIFNQLESTWPVHGSVLVKGGKAYFTAGRSSFVDGGIYLYALDPATGKVLHEERLENERPDVNVDGGRPFDIDGTNSDLLVAGDEDIYMLLKRFNADLTVEETERVTKLGDRFMEPHLMPTDGFLDTTWFNRTYWTYSERWPGYYFTYRGPKSGQILVFDDKVTYGLKVFTERRGHSPEFAPGGGYELFADRNTTKPVLDEMDIGAEKGRGFTRTEHALWTTKVPIRAKSMVLAGERLYIAGPPDLHPDDGAYESIIGQRGAIFRVVNAEDGESLDEFKIDEAPIFDGLMAAGGNLYMATMDGKLVCFGAK